MDVSGYSHGNVSASAITGIPVDKVAMTGEITLRGLVLPIGGLKKLLLATLYGYKGFNIENKKDLT